MAKYIAKIKEVGNPHILEPSIVCESMTKDDIIQFFGLDRDDVEWYKLYQVINGKEVEL